MRRRELGLLEIPDVYDLPLEEQWPILDDPRKALLADVSPHYNSRLYVFERALDKQQGDGVTFVARNDPAKNHPKMHDEGRCLVRVRQLGAFCFVSFGL